MKIHMFLSVFTMSAAIMNGQQNIQVSSGKITYDEKVKIELKLEGDAAAMAANLPKERRMEKILTFNGEAMLFEDGNRNVEDEMVPQSEHGDGAIRVRMMVSGENKIYTDLKTKKVIDQRDFMNRIFLVEKDLPVIDWKISGNQKMILGYNCIEATRTDTAGNKTVAWFAPSINVGGGPSGLGSLPGMILEADINNGSRIYVAKTVESLKPVEVKIQKPKDGKFVTEDEYKKIVAEKLKEMGVEEGAGGNQMRIVIRHQ
ncbi:MAG: GLPGLI family protein [Chloroflexota bacterium]